MRTIDIIQARAASLAKKTPAKPPAEWADDLRGHYGLCQDILVLVEQENRILRGTEDVDLQKLAPQKKNLLLKLNLSLDRLRQVRTRWQQLTPSEKIEYAEVGGLIRQNQDLILRILMLDRENEQHLLRRGMLPATQLPPVQRQNTQMATALYRKQSSGI